MPRVIQRSKSQGALQLRQHQPAAIGIVVEDLGVASPMNRRLELLPCLCFSEMFLENVVEEIVGQCTVGFGAQGTLDLSQQRDVGERRFAEEDLPRENVGFGEGSAFGGDVDVALVDANEPEQGGPFDDGEQIVHLHHQLIGKMIEIIVSTAIEEDLEQAGDATWPCVWQHLIAGGGTFSQRPWLHIAGGRRGFDLRLGEHGINIVNQVDEASRFTVAWMF